MAIWPEDLPDVDYNIQWSDTTLLAQMNDNPMELKIIIDSESVWSPQINTTWQILNTLTHYRVVYDEATVKALSSLLALAYYDPRYYSFDEKDFTTTLKISRKDWWEEFIGEAVCSFDWRKN